MSDILLPSIDNNKLINNITIFSNKRKRNNLNENIKSYRAYLLGKNNINGLGQNSFKKAILKKSVNYKKNLKADLKIYYTNKNLYKSGSQLKRFLKNKTYFNLNNNIKNNKNSNLFINKSYNSLIFDNKSENYFSNININKENNLTENSKYNNYEENYENKKMTSDINSTGDSFNSQKKPNSKSIEVNKIVDSLINKSHKSQKNNKIKISKFPNEKSIDPFSYIKHNLQKNPYDTLYRGIKSIMKQFGKGIFKEEYENNLIKKASDVNDLKVDSNHMQAPLGEAKIYKNKYENMINQTKTYRAFHFNKNENNKKNLNLKGYEPQLTNLDKTYKLYFNKKFKFNNNESNNNKLERNRTKTDLEFDKIDKCLSFDKKINNIIFISKNTENNINKKSKEHEEMLSKFNFILKSYSYFK